MPMIFCRYLESAVGLLKVRTDWQDNLLPKSDLNCKTCILIGHFGFRVEVHRDTEQHHH